MGPTPATASHPPRASASVWSLPPLDLPRALTLLLIAITLASALLTGVAGFGFGFTHDDLMNISVAAGTPWSALLLDTAAFWRMPPEARPAAALLLKAVYAVCGLDITAWRCVYALLLLLATGVTLTAYWRCTACLPAAVIPALLLGFTPGLGHLYFSMGLVFDVLASIGAGLFLLAWAHLRPRWGLNWRRQAVATLVLAVLLVLALQAKEAAVSALLLAALYELLYDPPRLADWRRRALELPPLALLFAISVAFTAARLWDAASLTRIAHYRLEVSLTGYLLHLRTWLSSLNGWQTSADGGLGLVYRFLILLLALVAAFRRVRSVAWCALGFLAAVLPLAFIPQRGVDSIYIALPPLLALLGLVFDIVLRRLRSDLALYCLVLTSLGILLWQGSPDTRRRLYAMRDVDLAIMPALRALNSLPPPSPGDHIVVRSDPFAEMEWSTRYLLQLRFRQPQLDVRRRARVEPAELAQASGHWSELNWDAQRRSWHLAAIDADRAGAE